MVSRDIARLANAAHYRLHQAIDAFFFWTSHLAKAKFGLALGSFAEADGHLAAQTIFDEGGFVARTPYVPGIDADNREIAQQPFAAARSCDQVLRLVSAEAVEAVLRETRISGHVS